MRAHTIDKLGLGVAAAGALGSVVWFALATPEFPSGATLAVETPGKYAVRIADAPKTTEVDWGAPAAQERGDGWIYNVFSPPDVYYDETSRRLSAVLPRRAAPPARPEALAASPPTAELGGLELRSVEQTLFPLQLVGYVGEEGREFGVFAKTTTGETILARGGYRLTDLELVVDRVWVSRERVSPDDGTDVTWRVAAARVRDERTGTTVRLTDRGRVFAGEPIALVVCPGVDELPRTVKVGDRLTVNGADYEVHAIRVSPPQMELTPAEIGHGATGGVTLTATATDAADLEKPSSI